jgi:hypothetical protein
MSGAAESEFKESKGFGVVHLGANDFQGGWEKPVGGEDGNSGSFEASSGGEEILF